ncbi:MULTISPECIES: peptide MFS transporter [Blastomonas]|jgi:POT family proton-dependent oligopeptide transporter|uniref:MFS transporter n=2 Tax=Blastomonas fulva TaxID=1550728 RepID=A0ABN5B3V1_9SPHN|nr:MULTISPECIES: peptide MFS transporter [Blastomonas]AOF98988.1 amino acid/peptide transporter family protein [Blastomonas sp. RAC04]ASR51800.1 MFS transporter [Blastomonas fulva]MDK2756004.1 peptide MFS transporter [Blastomonas fulva]MDM7929063.1 peptide MFS transporter [Blastomonas fulva]MDM7967299.1 peptide MFS transporter [Blastomonas fulva]
MASGYAVSGDSKGTFLGHPKGLYVLFFAEMWERFSYYGMRALLIFYLTKHWLFSDEKSGVIYGAYTALVYITPVLGGYLADRYLGQRKAVTFGAVLLTFGHALMGFEGTGGQDPTSLSIFWLALAFIIVGSGFLKANISVIVGQLYPRTDVRRDGAYTIFYMGINLGAFLGSLACGYLGETYGWSYGFGAAGIGMLLGLVVFILGKPLLCGRGESPDPAALAAPVMGIKKEWLIYGVGIAAVLGIWALIQYQDVVGWLLLVSGVVLVGYVLITAVTKLEPHDRDRIFAAMFLILGSILFWALFEQAGSSLNLYTDRYVDRGGVPASVFQSVNAMYIVLLAPFFAGIWTWLGRKGLEPSAPAKFGLAMVQLGAGFLVLVAGAAATGAGVPTPVLFIFLIYLLHTTGELCLSPVGLSAMNRLAPAHMASLIMGTWFFASASGNFVAGLIAAATGSEAASGEGAGQQTVLDVYSNIGWIAIGVGVAVMVVSPLIKKLMHLDTLKDVEPLAGEAELAEAQAAGINPATRGA